MPAPALLELELDLDCFQGPFDLLIALILREELDLLEVELADVVLAYLDHLERRGELDLEAATEFLVLIAALLELKSRLMLPADAVDEELDELEPGEAAEELLARMLQYMRYKGASGWMAERFEAGQARLYRAAPPPRDLRDAELEAASPSMPAALLGDSIGRLLRMPPPLRVDHLRAPRVTVGERLDVLRKLLRRSAGPVAFEDAVRDADTHTVCMTLWALLELYRRGEAAWHQDEPFGEITVASTNGHAPPAAAEAAA